MFSLARITEYFNGDIFRTIYLIILTVILSIFSYTFVEKPARNKNNKFSSVGCVLLALGTLVSGFCVFNLCCDSGLVPQDHDVGTVMS